MTLTWVALILGLGTWALIVVRTRPEWPSWRKEDFLILAGIAPAAALFWLVLLKNPVQGLDREFNAARLAPVCSLLRGYTLYYPPDQGPILNLIYPPLAALAYLPAAFFPSPASAVLVAGVLVQAYLVVPLFLCFWKTRAPGRRGEAFVLLLFFALVGFLNRNYATAHWFQYIHADAPSLGFALLACRMFLTDRPELSRRALVAAALFASCSIYSKQTSVGVAVGLAGYLLFVTGWRRSLEFLAFTGAFSLLFGLVSIAAFGWGPLVFNVFTVPSRHPLNSWNVTSNALDWASGGLAVLAIAVPLVLLRERRETPAEERSALKKRPWVLFLFVSLAMIPTSLMSRLKEGGFDNSYQFLMYLNLAAAMSLGLQGWGREGSPFRPWFATLAVSTCLLSISGSLVLGPTGRNPLSREFGRDSLLSENEYTEADRLWQDHPGEVHFPFNPLTPLYRAGRLTHFEYGLYDRGLAGFAPSDEHFLRYLPARISLLATTAGFGHDLERYRRLAPAGTRFRKADFGNWNIYVYER